MIEFENFSKEIAKKAAVLNSKAYSLQNVTSNPSWLLHKHQKNPDGSSLYVSLTENGVLKAHISIQKRLMSKSGEVAFANNPVDLVSLSPQPMASLLLYRQVQTRLNQDGELAYHTSNPNSEIFYSKLLKKTPKLFLGMKVMLVSVPNSFRMARLVKFIFYPYKQFQKFFLMVFSRGSSLELLSISSFTNRHFGEMGILDDNLFLKRDAERLNWRFSEDNPHQTYQRYLLVKQGQTVGYFVVTSITHQGIEGLAVVDFFCPKLKRSERVKIAYKLIQLSGSSNIIFSVVNFDSKISKFFHAFPFLGLPSRLQPQFFPIYLMNGTSKSSVDKEALMTLFDLDIL